MQPWGLGHVEARCQEVDLGPRLVWLKSKHVSHILLSPSVCGSWKLGWKWNWSLNELLQCGMQESEVMSTALPNAHLVLQDCWGLLQDFFLVLTCLCYHYHFHTWVRNWGLRIKKGLWQEHTFPSSIFQIRSLCHNAHMQAGLCFHSVLKARDFSQEIPDKGIFLKSRSNGEELGILPMEMGTNNHCPS